jgi:hypothetical protein
MPTSFRLVLEEKDVYGFDDYFDGVSSFDAEFLEDSRVITEAMRERPGTSTLTRHITFPS